MDPVVRLSSAVSLLGRFPALAGVNLEVERGEILLLSGPNGAGKTTLLRLLAGLQPPHRGTAVVLGHDLSDPGARRRVRRHATLVGHESFCYDDLTVDENLRFAARAAGRRREVADAMVERFQLAGVRAVSHARLSSGQRRRLALAAGFARDPELVLLDEPHAGLDAGGRDLLDEVIASAPAAGHTVIFASHELDRARSHCTREVELRGGRAVAAPEPSTARPSPAPDHHAVAAPPAVAAP